MFDTTFKGESDGRWLTRLARLQPWYLIIRYPYRATRSIFAVVGGILAIGILCTAAVLTDQVMIFPSLGPSVFLFFSQPNSPTAAPRNAILAHIIGFLTGWLSYWFSASWVGDGTSAAQVIAASMSLGIISGLMLTLELKHPPAASTTLIVALGAMTQGHEFVAVVVSVVMVTYLAFLLNRLSGIAAPVWHPRPSPSDDELVTSALATSAKRPKTNRYAEVADQLIAKRGDRRAGKKSR